MKNLTFILLSVVSMGGVAVAAEKADSDNFHYKISPIPPAEKILMEKYTWRPGCPVALKDLSYITLSYWGFDHQDHAGILVVNKRLAREVVNIFHQLYIERFPIERMEPMTVFKGNDNAAMAANNTSAFNCRANTTYPNQYSLHSYGYAIDVNTLINPYVKGDKVEPLNGRAYLNRTRPVLGMILPGDKIYQAFVKRGWTWGGEAWPDRQDYQHFEKKL